MHSNDANPCQHDDTWPSSEHTNRNILNLCPIHTNKTGLITPGLTKWNSATESWMTSWNKEFKWAFTCFFICTKFAVEKD